MSTQQVTRYHPLLVALHWALAILIIADLVIGSQLLVHIPNDVPKKLEGLRAHMSGGVIILALMLMRVAVRLFAATPVKATAGNAFLDRLAWLSHRAVYVSIFGMIFSGLAVALQAHLPDVVFLGRGHLPESFWIYPLRGVHYFFSRALMVLIGLHIMGALYHTFLRRDRLLRRMWFGRRFEDPRTELLSDSARGGAFWRHAPWVGRVILLPPTLLFIQIGLKYVVMPQQVAAGSQMVLGSPAAVTDLRAFGAIFLGLGIATLLSLLATRRLLAGLTLTALVVGCATAARLLGIALDGAAHESVFKLVPEVVLTLLSVIGIVIERQRRRHFEAIKTHRVAPSVRHNAQAIDRLRRDSEARHAAA